MRRWRFVLIVGAALLAVEAALLLAPLLFFALDPCLLGCDVTTTGPEARPRVEAVLGLSLPAGADVAALEEGGFQDGFARVRVEADVGAAEALLAAMGLSFATMEPVASDTETPGVWDAGRRSGARRGDGRVPGFPHANVVVAPPAAPGGRWTLTLFAFET